MDAAILEMDTGYTVTTDGSAVCANSTGEMTYLYVSRSNKVKGVAVARRLDH